MTHDTLGFGLQVRRSRPRRIMTVMAVTMAGPGVRSLGELLWVYGSSCGGSRAEGLSGIIVYCICYQAIGILY